MKIRQNLVSENKYNIKCPYSMIPEFVVVHNTANDASADNEIKYMISNNNQVSFHYAVDDKEIVQGIPTNRNAWHSGDGKNGQGNRKGIAIEICYSKSGGERFNKAEKLASEFIASILKQKGWGINKVKKHQDFQKKYCPHRTLDLGWDRFLKMIESNMKTSSNNSSNTAPSGLKHKVGEIVSYNKIFVSSTSNTALKPSIKSGVITKIYNGTRNPYLIGNGIGFVNDDCITTVSSAPKPKILKVTPRIGLWLLDSKGNKIKAYSKGTKVEVLGNGYTKNGYEYYNVRIVNDKKTGYMAKKYLG